MLASVTSLRSRFKTTAVAAVTTFYKFIDDGKPESIQANREKVRGLLKDKNFTFHVR
jgi:hypothetical protein